MACKPRPAAPSRTFLFVQQAPGDGLNQMLQPVGLWRTNLEVQDSRAGASLSHVARTQQLRSQSARARPLPALGQSNPARRSPPTVRQVHLGAAPPVARPACQVHTTLTPQNAKFVHPWGRTQVITATRCLGSHCAREYAGYEQGRTRCVVGRLRVHQV